MPEPRIALYARILSEPDPRRHGLSVVSADETACEGTSGSTLLRPALERLRDAAAAGVLDQVHVLAPDRLARRYA